MNIGGGSGWGWRLACRLMGNSVDVAVARRRRKWSKSLDGAGESGEVGVGEGLWNLNGSRRAEERQACRDRDGESTSLVAVWLSRLMSDSSFVLILV